MPAAAVIPASIAYIKVVAVKKLVVGSQAREDGRPHWSLLVRPSQAQRASVGCTSPCDRGVAARSP